MSVRLAIAGASGRMGQALVEAALDDPRFALAGALDVPGSPSLGRDAGERIGRATGVRIDADVARALAAADVLVDFTRPEGTLAHVAACEAAGVAMVIGTTGLDAVAKERLAAAGKSVPLVFAPNMSVGINVLLELVRVAAQRLGPGFDIEIVEMHHRHKIDAPSGTALALGEAAAQGAGVRLDDHAVFAREGVTGERKGGTIGFATLRGGDVVGEHAVVFAGAGERVELVHRATSRRNFATGALRAALFVADARAKGRSGLYAMADVLGLSAP
jgi:4-hydroxy-tetrahydrodipicolinate reductase